MKIIKLLFIILLLIVVAGGAWIAVNRSKVNAFTYIISGFYSKLMCSCLFVEGRTEEQCHRWARQYVPIQWCKIDREEKSVTVKGMGRTNTARYMGPRFGCTLE